MCVAVLKAPYHHNDFKSISVIRKFGMEKWLLAASAGSESCRPQQYYTEDMLTVLLIDSML